MLRRRPSLILFDLDGTLVDSAPDLSAAIDKMLLALKRPPAGEAKVRGWIGHGVPMLVKRALTGAMWPEIEPVDFRRGLELYMNFYGEEMAERTTLYPGVSCCLEKLKSFDLPMACVTNKHSTFTRSLLQKMGILDYFRLVVSGDEVPKPKPDPAALLWVASRLGIDPGATLMVGDSPADALSAKAAGMMLALVSYGYHGEKAPQDWDPDLLLETLSALPPKIEAAPVPLTA